MRRERERGIYLDCPKLYILELSDTEYELLVFILVIYWCLKNYPRTQWHRQPFAMLRDSVGQELRVQGEWVVSSPCCLGPQLDGSRLE